MSFISSPGPGAYNTVKKSAAPSYTMRKKTKLSNSYSNPSPDAYNPTSVFTKNRAPSYTMRSRTTANARDGVPGPGHYTSPGLFGRAHAKSMTARRASNMTSFTPGPGAYNPSARTLPKAPGYSLTGRPSGIGGSFNTPGPGKYNSAPLFRSGKGFSMSGRITAKESQGGTPGPGRYNINPGVIKYRSPVFSMRLKTNQQCQFYSSTNKAPGVLTRLEDGTMAR